jgi:carbon monoxide dehydrogenase subunit G
MPTVENDIVIERPKEAVWGFLIDPSNASVWQSNVVEFESEVRGEGTPGIGERGRGVVKIAGRRIETRTETVDVVPGEVVALQTLDAPFPMLTRYGLEANGDVTRLTVRFETPGFGGFFGKLTDPIVAKMIDRDARSSLANLKTILESSG